MLRKLLLAATLACAVSGLAIAPALAADPAVIVPYGAWIAGIGDLAASVLVPLLAGAILVALRTYLPILGAFVSQSLVERLVGNATDYALNAVKGAVKGAVLDVPTGSAVIARSVQRAVDQAPAWLLREAGGPKGVAEKAFRLIHLDAAATAANTLAPALKAVAPPRA